MNMTEISRRIALSPTPISWWRRQYRRTMLAAMQPIDDPAVILVRPYGIARGLGMSSMPLDYTMAHYGGSMRGSKIGFWKDNLMVAPDPQSINAPTIMSWRGNPAVMRQGEQWVIDDWDESKEL